MGVNMTAFVEVFFCRNLTCYKIADIVFVLGWVGTIVFLDVPPALSKHFAWIISQHRAHRRCSIHDVGVCIADQNDMVDLLQNII